MRTSHIFSTLTHFPHKSINFIRAKFLNLTILITIINDPITIWNHLVLVITHLKCAFELLLHNQFSFITSHNTFIIPKTGIDQLNIKTTTFSRSSSSNDNGDQCAVCLSEVVAGDEIGELKCCHVFHHRCLTSWVRSSKLMTCPLCRGTLAFEENDHLGHQVLFFNYCSFGSISDDRDDHDSWWLR